MFEKIKAKLNKNHDKNCLKCQYNELFIEGKQIFDKWDKKGKAPKNLVEIQKNLIKLKKQIKNNNSELIFCSNHPEIFEFLPSEWT